MMDSYNLAWKLAYSINGLAPISPTGQADPILDTYHQERHTIAHQLIEFDKAFSSMFSGKIGAEVGGLTHDEFLEVFSRGNGFTSGCGVEYPENLTVHRSVNGDQNPITGTDYLSGILRPGRRLLNVRLVRHADGYRRDLQDGKYHYTHPRSTSFNQTSRFHLDWPIPHSMPCFNRSFGSKGHFSKSTCRPEWNHLKIPEIRRGASGHPPSFVQRLYVERYPQ